MNKKTKSSDDHQRPVKTAEFLTPLEGTVSTEGFLTNFVAENFESKLKNSIVKNSNDNQSKNDDAVNRGNGDPVLVKDKTKANENFPLNSAAAVGHPINERITAIKSQQQQPQQTLAITRAATSSTSPVSASSSTSSPSTASSASSSSSTSSSSSSSTTSSYLIQKQFLLTNQLVMAAIDPNVLNDVEIESQYLAASVDSLTENLCNLLHSISSITADNVELYKNAVNKLTDCMDTNIKSMYTIMAKAEEITNLMKPTEALGQRIRDIKRLVDVFDSNI